MNARNTIQTTAKTQTATKPKNNNVIQNGTTLNTSTHKHNTKGNKITLLKDVKQSNVIQYIVCDKKKVVIKTYKTEKGANKYIGLNTAKGYKLHTIDKKVTKATIANDTRQHKKDVVATKNTDLKIIQGNYSKKADNKETVKQLNIDNLKLDKSNIMLVNKDYQLLSNDDEFSNYSKVQKIAILKDRYKTKDASLSVVCDIKMMNLSLDNDLTVSQMKTVIKFINAKRISKGSINGKDTDTVKAVIARENKKIKNEKLQVLKDTIKKELLTATK